MKKIVGILGMAAVLASGAFAADPATNFVMSEFKGSAEFGWKADFAKTDDVKMGMYNDASASLKFGFITAGDKITTGDGVWGELKISNAASDAAAVPAAKVDTAKIHFVDGDFSMALNIIKPSIQYAGFTPVTAAPAAAVETSPESDPFGVTSKIDRKKLADAIADAKKAVDKKKTDADDLKGKDGWAEAYGAWEKAKADLDNFTTDGTTSIYAPLNTYWDENVKAKVPSAGALNLAKAEAFLANMPGKTAATATTLGTAGLADKKDADYTAGFGINVAMKDMFALNVNFVDNGFVNKDDATAKNSVKAKEYALGADLAVTVLPDLTAKVAQTTLFNKDGVKYFGLQALGGYNIKITDKLYVNPAVAFETVKAGKDAKLANALSAGVLFGWGAKAVGPTVDYFNDDPTAPKTFNEGISVAVAPTLKEKDNTVALAVSMYDQSLFSLLGIEDYGTLKTAFGFDSYITEKNASNIVRAAVVYDVKFSPVYVNVHGGMKATLANKDAEFVPSFKFGAKLGSTEIIDNTDVFVGFEAEGAAKKDNLDKAELTIGTKISF